MQQPPPTLEYQKPRGWVKRLPRSVPLTLSGLILGTFLGLLFGCGVLAMAGFPRVAWWEDALALSTIPIGAISVAFFMGRGDKVRLLAATALHEEFRHCKTCGTDTWHIFRRFDFGLRSIECLDCKAFRWL